MSKAGFIKTALVDAASKYFNSQNSAVEAQAMLPIEHLSIYLTQVKKCQLDITSHMRIGPPKLRPWKMGFRFENYTCSINGYIEVDDMGPRLCFARTSAQIIINPT